MAKPMLRITFVNEDQTIAEEIVIPDDFGCDEVMLRTFDKDNEHAGGKPLDTKWIKVNRFNGTITLYSEK